MPLVIKIPLALDKVLGEEASTALVEMFNQMESAQRNGLERALELRLLTLKESMDKRFDLTDERIKLALTEANRYTDQRITELEARMDKRFNELEARMDKRLNELTVGMDKRLNELTVGMDKRLNELTVGMDKRHTELAVGMDKRHIELAANMDVKIAQTQTTLIKWMFTFYIGSVVTITGLIIAYLQLFLKP